MKRLFLTRRIHKKILQKMLLIMKLSFVLFFIGSFCLYANYGYSQDARVELHMEKASLTDVFREIEKQSDYRFFYNNVVVNIGNKFSLSANNEPVSTLLANLFEGTNISYRMIEKYIVITEKNNHTVGTGLISTMVQQSITVTGTVVDENGEPMPGVNVVIKGMAKGVVTDVYGKYSISIPDRNITLVFSFIGYSGHEVLVGDKTQINVSLSESTLDLEEIVVVGYGTQKKVNLTGSITSVQMDDLEAIATPTLTQAIMGRTPGMFIKNINGQPGDNRGVQFNIRGFGEPLIIVDDQPMTTGEFTRLDPNDIESFNVLKDGASAAVYGARAGNGVILVKTKRGTVSKPVFSYNGNASLQFLTSAPKFVSSAQYAEMDNVARYNEGLEPLWTADEIQKLRDGSDYEHYPNTDWMGLVLKDYAMQTKHNISIRGGSEKVKYFVAGGYFHQDGILKSDDIKHDRYNLRSNIDVHLANKLRLGVDIAVNSSDYIGPRNRLERQAGDVSGIMTALFRARPYAHSHFPDPTKLSNALEYSPLVLSEIDNVGYDKWNKTTGDVKMNLSYELPWGFNIKALYGFYRNFYRQKVKTTRTPIYTYNWDTDVYTLASYTYSMSELTESSEITKNFNQQYFLTCNKSFSQHNLSALFVFEQLSGDIDKIEASRVRYEYNIDYLDAGPDLDKDNGGNASEDGRQSYVGRINYDYAGKYLFEFSSRYDGSVRFPKNSRWGFFPSVSAGWRMSEESFIKDNLSFVDNIKLRASYGRLGYDKRSSGDAVNQFLYLATYSIQNSPYIYDESSLDLEKGIRTGAIPNTNYTWEKLEMTNIGVDFSFWRNKIEGTFEYFYRKRSDVFGARTASLPNVVGATMPQQNYAQNDNRGWELSLSHYNKIGDWGYGIGGNLSWNREKRILIDQSVFASEEARRRGNRVDEWTDRTFMVRTDGLFSSMEEIQNWADQDGKNNATIRPGDVKKIDYNGDGRITNEDQVICGRGDYPRLSYGINMSVSWKGIDFSMLWQGAALYDFDLRNSADLQQPFYAANTPLVDWYKNSYVSEGNPWLPANTNARWPRYFTHQTGGGHSNFATSDFWLINGAYLRLKNVELAYTLPSLWMHQVGIEKCKVYVSGYNVLTFFELNFLDPEADTNPARTFGSYHPPLGNYTFGLSLHF